MAGNSLDLDAFTPDALADQIVATYDEWRDHRVKLEDRWSEVREYVYATTTQETSNAGVGGFSVDEDARDGWSHSTHIPKLAQIYDNLSANYMTAMFSRKKWVDFVGHEQDAAKKNVKEKVQGYVLTKNALNGFRNEIQKCVDDWIQTGNCFGLVEYVEESHIDPDTGDKAFAYKGPKLTRISPYDIVFNPLASSFERTPKIVRTLKSIGELMRGVEENPEKKYLEEVIEKAKDMRLKLSKADGRHLRKYRYLQVQGFNSPLDYLKSGYVEVLEFYGDLYNHADGEFHKNKVITVIDRAFIVRNEPIKTWNGQPMIFHCGWRTRPETLWAMGPLENLVGMQYMINHLQNTKADAFDEFVIPTLFTKGDVTLEGEKFGGLLPQRIHIDGADGDAALFRPDASFLQANLDIQYLEALMESYAGAPREAMGIRTAGEKTAFEVQQLQSAAARMFQNKIDYFSEQFLEKVVNGQLEVARRYLDGKDVIEVLDDDNGVQLFLDITKEHLKSNGRLVPVGSKHFAEKARVAQSLQILNQVLLPEERMHITSFDLTNAFVTATDIAEVLPVKKFARLEEQMEAQQLGLAMQEQAMLENEVAPQ